MLYFFLRFVYYLFIFGYAGSQLWYAGSSLRHVGSFVVARRLPSSCGARVFSSLVVACGLQGAWALQLQYAGSRARGLCSLWHTGSLVEACELSSCGARAQLPRGMWDLSSLTRDRTHVPCIGRRILYHWTTREVPSVCFKIACVGILAVGLKANLQNMTESFLSYKTVGQIMTMFLMHQEHWWVATVLRRYWSEMCNLKLQCSTISHPQNCQKV